MKMHIKYNKIKRQIGTCLIGLGLLSFAACSEDAEWGQTPVDNIAPGKPEVTKIENLNGGAVIHYKTPTDLDLLYVMASYKINDKEHIVKASVYDNKLKIEGFGKKGEYPVVLKCVDKSKNESEPVNITVNPDRSPVELIYESLEVSPSFGGIRLTWDNPTESNIIVSIVMKDSIGDYINLENFYSSTKDGMAALRGMDTTTVELGVYIRDRWDNYSETQKGTYTPLFEEMIPKSKFREVVALPGDAEASGSFPIRMIWDGNTSGNGDTGFYHGNGNNGGGIGKFITFDMGSLAKLSRFKMWQRTNANSFIYSHNNLKRYVVYGCTEITAEMRASGSLEGWTLIKETLCYKPSGTNSGVVTNEDKEYILGGDEHEISLDAPNVRYIRIHMLENWSGGIIPQIGEMTFWGQTINN